MSSILTENGDIISGSDSSAGNSDNDSSKPDNSTIIKKSYWSKRAIIDSDSEGDSHQSSKLTINQRESLVIVSSSDLDDDDDFAPNQQSKRVQSSKKVEKVLKDSSSSDDCPITNQSSEPPIKPQTVDLTDDMTKIKGMGNINSNNAQFEISVTEAEYIQQSDKVAHLKKALSSLKSSIASVDFNILKDKGKGLIDKEKSISNLLEEERIKLERMKISLVTKPTTSLAMTALTWEQLQREAALVQPATFGKRAVKTVDTQRTMTMDGLRNLHSSLEERPGEDVLADTPSQCKVELMPHQRHGLAFMLWRETKQPSGGLLADDMGLGKTLTVISLCLATLSQTRKAQESKEWKTKSISIRPAGVLVVCPASVLGQWTKEVKQRLKRNSFEILEYHGTNRHQDVRFLHRADMVLTTFATLSREHANNTQLYNLKWRRVILDEAHQVRNYKTQGSEAACALRAQSRWAVTGTPVHNKELDMFGIMKFLHCEPFDDIVVWKRWVGNKGTGGQQRLHSALQALMLRRTKSDMIESGALCTFPERIAETIKIKLDRDEQLIYSKIMVFSRNMFAQFLQQRAEKQGLVNDDGKSKDAHFDKMRREVLKINKYSDVKQSQILVLLLRLRQICIHPTLITKMLETTDIETVGTSPDDPPDGKDEMLDLLDQLDKLKLQDTDGEHNPSYTPNEQLHGNVDGAGAADQMTLNDAVKAVFKKDHPVFDPKRKSSKIRACLELVKNKIVPAGDKAVLVSQWTSLLKLIAEHLKEDAIQFCCLDGTVKIPDRQPLIDKLNSPNNSCKIMLLSLTAGGVGLNLMGANHLLILDPHWNPQLETQAQDRIYRMGQTKTVHIYRFLASDSIEERISTLQMKKMEIAHGMLTGTTVTGNKLTLNDLRMLFNM